MIGTLSSTCNGVLVSGVCAWRKIRSSASAFLNHTGAERSASGPQDRQLLIATSDELEARLIDAQLVCDVHKTALDDLRVEMQGLHQQMSSMGEELTFYKRLMAPEDVQQGLQIDDLEVNQESEGVYRFDLLLTQVALRRSFITGEVRIDVVGRNDNAQVVKSLTELGYTEAYPLKFKFRYFQDIAGTFSFAQLEQEFVPETVLITAKQKGKDEVQLSFPWAQ